MMDTAAAFLFRGLTSSKAKQVPQTLTHTHRGCGCSGCQRQGTAFNSIHTLNAFRSDVTARFPSSSSTGKGWHSVVKVRALLCIPQALPWPLCSPAGPARCLLQTLPQVYSTLVDLQKYQHEPCPPHTPVRSQSHSVASSA